MAVERQVDGVVHAPAVVAPSLVQLASDYLALLKPKIILLLVLTELGSMVAAAHGLPRAGVLVGSLLGGAMAAGGSGAINCWFDRDIDAIMPRTRRRPIPAGRVKPAHGLTFGIATAVAGVVVIAVSSNLLAAALAAAGGLVYVFVYTMLLKRSTAQNIVIGGSAGAFPPLVGWAAATGVLTPAAWALFAIVFFWTPPHFWALALVLRRQYAAVSVPMLPAVTSSRHTRRAIFAYTAVMLAVSLVPAYWLGAPYAVSAIVLGGVFLGFAINALRHGDGRSALALFHYSLGYLALLFVAAGMAGVLAR